MNAVLSTKTRSTLEHREKERERERKRKGEKKRDIQKARIWTEPTDYIYKTATQSSIEREINANN